MFMSSKLYPQTNGNFFSVKNTGKNWLNKQIVNLILLICFFVPLVSNAQQMLTTPTSLYNYHKDNRDWLTQLYLKQNKKDNTTDLLGLFDEKEQSHGF